MTVSTTTINVTNRCHTYGNHCFVNLLTFADRVNGVTFAFWGQRSTRSSTLGALRHCRD